MRDYTLILLSIWLVLVVCAISLRAIYRELEDCRIVYLSRESRGDAAAVSATRLSDPGDDR